MKNKIFYVLIFVFINGYYVVCQEKYNVDKWTEYIEDLASVTEDEEELETLYNELSYLIQHPFDINIVKSEQLQKLPFLSDNQIEEIITYRNKYDHFASIYELKHITTLDFETIELLLPFIKIGTDDVDKLPFTVKNLVNSSRNELLIRIDKCFQQKAGYGSYPDSVLQSNPNKRYLGESYYNSVRYGYNFHDRIVFGIIAEKDAGEPFWNSTHKGYDYYSAHLLFKDINKWLKTVALGDYKASFGQGLVLSQDFSMSRSALVTNIERRSNGIKRHFSTNEKDYLRGGAATVSINNLDISVLYSYKQLDATVENSEIISFKTDGLHRLPREREKMRTVNMQTFGANLRYSRPFGHIGLSSVYYTFGSLSVNPPSKPYNLYYFRGSDNINISTDYKFYHKKVKFYGETAISKNGAVATLNALEVTPLSYFSFLLMQRYYDKKYQAFYARAFSQNSLINNEQGIYVGLKWTPFSYWQLAAYADVYKTPWLSYNTDHPKEESEYMVQIDCNKLKNISITARYRMKARDSYDQQQLRTQFIYKPSPSLTLKTSLDGNLYKKEGSETTNKGMMISQNIDINNSERPLKGSLYMAYFNTEDYFSRVYSYEKNLLYAFNNNQFYGKGYRLAATLSYKAFGRLSIAAKFGLTKYIDQNTIGTSLEQINGSIKSDLLTMIGYKF